MKLKFLIEKARWYLPITLQLSRSALKSEAEMTLVGFLWWIAEPVFYCAVYYFTFAVIFHTKTENFVAFMLLGLLVWRWFIVTLNRGTAAIKNNSGLMGQIDIPKIIFPLEVLFTETFKFVIALLGLLTIYYFFGYLSVHTVYVLPMVVGLTAFFFFGLVSITSLILPIFPDLQKLFRLTMRGLLFVSGVFYESSRVPEKYLDIYYLNPLTIIVESFRNPIMHGILPHMGHLAYLAAVSTLLCIAGIYMHIRMNRRIPRYLI